MGGHKFDVTTTAVGQGQPGTQAGGEVGPSRYLAQGLEVGVWVPVWQNFLGGIGVTGLVVIGRLAIGHPADMNHGLDLAAGILPAALAAGGVIFFTATIIRAFRDEVSFLVATWAQGHNREIERAQALRIKALEERLQEIERSGQVSSRFAIYKTVELMLSYWEGGKADGEKERSLSRRECDAQLGIGRPEWEAATKVLREAGIVGDNGKVLVSDYATAWASVVKRMRGSHQFVRTADGDFAQV